VLTPRYNTLMSYGAGADKPIYVIGSGKTAMDCIGHLHTKLPSARGRLHCIAGRGTWFINRAKAFPQDRWEIMKPTGRTGTDYFIDMMELVRRPLRPFWQPLWLRFTYVTSVLVKKY
jgi:lysine/ornithine N-monooxygenase